MTPRTASLRVAHQGTCPNATKTALTSAGRASGCKCAPSFYTFHRNRDGKPEKGSRIKSRQVADRAGGYYPCTGDRTRPAGGQ